MEKTLKPKKLPKGKRGVFLNKILYQLSQVLIVGFIIFVGYKFFRTKIFSNGKEIGNIQNDINKFETDIRELETRSTLTKKYINLWNNELGEEQKKTNGVDVDKIKEALIGIIEDNYIIDPEIKFTPVTALQLAGERKIIDIVNSELTLKFNVITEYSLYYLIEELTSRKLSFMDLETFSIKKIKNLDKTVINNLVSGKLDYVFEVNLAVQLYGTEPKKVEVTP